MVPTYFDIDNKYFPFTNNLDWIFDLQKQIENDGNEHYDPVDMQYIGNKNITTTVKNLKTELTLVRSDAPHIVSCGEGIEETVEAIGQLFSEVILLGFNFCPSL